jgi:hypothetical protein
MTQAAGQLKRLGIIAEFDNGASEQAEILGLPLGHLEREQRNGHACGPPQTPFYIAG